MLEACTDIINLAAASFKLSVSSVKIKVYDIVLEEENIVAPYDKIKFNKYTMTIDMEVIFKKSANMDSIFTEGANFYVIVARQGVRKSIADNNFLVFITA